MKTTYSIQPHSCRTRLPIILSSLSDFNLRDILLKILYALILILNRARVPVQFIRIIEYFSVKE